jgi:hypothetical protein
MQAIVFGNDAGVLKVRRGVRKREHAVDASMYGFAAERR